MKKNFLFLPLLALVGSTLLSSCNAHLSVKDGALIQVGDKEYSLQEIYDISRDSQTAASSYYTLLDNVYTELAYPDNAENDAEVDKQMQTDFYDAAETNAENNNTTVKEEQEALLESEKVDTVEELREKKYLALKKQDASDLYYSDANVESSLLKPYIDENAPYHVKHILIKVSAETGELHRATITSDEAKKLGRVVERLASGEEDFGDIAHTASEDTGSAANFGDLGVMDKNTSFVNEFKLGDFVWDMAFNNAADHASALNTLSPSNATTDNFPTLDDSNGTFTTFDNALESYTLFGIPYSSAVALNSLAETEADETGHTATNAESANYPRNVIFNNYYNNHAMSLIFLSDEDAASLTSTYGLSEEATAYSNLLSEADNNRISKTIKDLGLSGKLKTYKAVLKQDASGTYSTTYELVDVPDTARVLTDENGNPILVARAGNGSASSDSDSSSTYEGVHFIVNQRDPFVTYMHQGSETVYTDEEYYNISVTDATAEGAETNYLNYIHFSDPSDYTTRASDFKNDIKNADINSTYTLFNYNKSVVEDNGYKINVPETIQSLVDQYIDSQESKNEYDHNNTYDRAWTTYFQALNFQQSTVSLNLPIESLQQFSDGNIPIYISLSNLDIQNIQNSDGSIDLSKIPASNYTNYKPTGEYGVNWIYNPAYVGSANGQSAPSTGTSGTPSAGTSENN